MPTQEKEQHDIFVHGGATEGQGGLECRPQVRRKFSIQGGHNSGGGASFAGGGVLLAGAGGGAHK